MLKIALFTNNFNRLDFYKKVESIRKESAKLQGASTIHVFRSQISPEMDSNQMTGEYNIFFLPDLSDYDVFLLDLYWTSGDCWLDREQGKSFLEKIREQKKPAISIGNHLEGFVNIAVDADSAMRQVMDHLTRIHGCRSFWFVSDMWVDSDTRLRMETCRKYTEQADLPCSQHLFVEEYGATLQSLQKGFEKLLQESGELPDAIVCSDDHVAIGLMQAAAEKGFHAPSDYRIVGFGNIKEGMFTIPSLFTRSGS